MQLSLRVKEPPPEGSGRLGAKEHPDDDDDSMDDVDFWNNRLLFIEWDDEDGMRISIGTPASSIVIVIVSSRIGCCGGKGDRWSGY
eukprot:CAMPEP_0198119238 /NCGR_PEP_ID=MMETSP1442-20131203/24745_1 /TAXON_ID= /ORGANISM="Craspedostauros australis, Strain CCMP3328" /LENGTH=85 /DNA_ID=CAMNT_0043777657 /DNA_START=676 /DNA_END=933 /DNA_ORIENTATION=-